ncbi:phosphatase PAP2 family protein [Adhaeribacter sp. BT258]|uniref:Phosphatase PAP2 family protein n=1 Tax=Adhaeribacter terrigena TaxID=2793070 RepID=A0ABS1BZW6_9BACT|nr:phosphatase PAP2 family protein [Adhaeribacter terrigena]MBK0402715.1 phosphatase PAP2 family protein [Adhaeribacter terrigena]
MQQRYRFWLLFFFPVFFFSTELKAQQTDTLQKYQDPVGVEKPKAPFYKSKVFKATIVPAVLIGYGVSTIKDNGFYSSYDAQRDILKNFPNFDTWLDDAFLVAPYFELAAANIFNQRSNNDLLNTTLVILKAEAIFGVTVFTMKNLTNQLRPNGENRESLPSGHTAQAFLAASILHTELKHRSNWYGVGAYGIATSVGAFRMLKNKHWQSDVFVGAGIGILSSHVAYLSHRNRWGRKPTVVMAPTYLYGVPGISLAFNFDEMKRKNLPDTFGQKRLSTF